MSIREIRVKNIRSYELYSTALDPHVTLILGRNGTGKTTLLEGLYYLMQGTSFRGRDRDMIAYDEKTADIVAVDEGGAERRARIAVDTDDKVKKTFTLDNRQSLRMPLRSRLPVVLFEPDELRLLTSSPQRRRQFFDDILCRLHPAYATALSRYSRVLLQRNELLKRQYDIDSVTWDAHLFAWDVNFVELAGTIVRLRQDFIASSNERLSRLYSSMAGKPHTITAEYVTSTPQANYAQALLAQLESRRHSDAQRGFTSVGPHRDDIAVSLDGHAASEVASRGEMRTIMLAYKLLEVELQREAYGTDPLILMDDVFSELDSVRERHLMHALEPYQTIITATDLRDELKISAKIITLK